MSYKGQIASIPLGTGGLFTDAAQCNIPPTNLVWSENVTYYNGVLQKDYGSRQWNTSALPSGIARFNEFFPDNQGQEQRVICLLNDGTVYRFPNNYTQEVVTPTGSAPANLNANNYNSMIIGGNESAGRAKKLFIFTGYDPVQVISGDTITRSNISMPPADWTGTNQPFGAVMHRGRIFAFGAPNNPHFVYASSATNHEDYTTSPLTFNVFPGEGDSIVQGVVFRGRLFIFKYPLGAYYLVDDDTNSANWYFKKFGDDFGGVSPQAACVAGDDLLLANNYGSLTSLLAAFQFGDLSSSDVFHQFGIRRFTVDQIRPDAIFKRDMIFYGYKKYLYAVFQSYLNPYPDRIFVMDLRNSKRAPLISWNTKDQPNCLGLIRDVTSVPRPFYGANDGFLYQMDVEDRWVGPQAGDTRVAYEMRAQTPHMDFSQGNPLLGGQVKQFDALQLEYEGSGGWNVDIDVYIDSRFMGTYTIEAKARSNLNQLPLANSVVDGWVGFTDMVPIYGEGKKISFVFRNNGLGEDVRLVKIFVYYKLLGDQETIG